MAEAWVRLCLGKSGLHQGMMLGNAQAGQPDGQRHREQTAFYRKVRVKRWSKSPPRRWQHRWHGKPHQEQCQIGAARGQPQDRLDPSRSGLAARGCLVTGT